MFVSANPLLAFKGKRGTFHERYQIRWEDGMKQIKELYFDHKFKQCAALCEDHLGNKQAHPLHETFLHFYAAICHESLGLLAHNYSSNKLPFLNQARDQFAAALAALPLPYSTTETGTYECPEDSPQVLQIPATPSSIYASAPRTPRQQMDTSDTASGTASDEDSDDESYTSFLAEFDSYTHCQRGFRVDAPEDDKDHLSLCQLTSEQRNRLSQSLSAGHVVQEMLLPKPLFAKRNEKKIASIQPPPPPPYPATPAQRALPPIPTRHPVLRKTALQTLLNPGVSANLDCASSPITPRFTHIRSTFAPKPQSRSLHTCSSSTQHHHLQRYNAHLPSLRTQLHQHIASIDTLITHTISLQVQRQTRLNKTSNRLASFWSLSVRSGQDEESGRKEKRERIERLRGGGWNVSKSRHGWKGEGYYEELRGRALADLDVSG